MARLKEINKGEQCTQETVIRWSCYTSQAWRVRGDNRSSETWRMELYGDSHRSVKTSLQQSGQERLMGRSGHQPYSVLILASASLWSKPTRSQRGRELPMQSWRAGLSEQSEFRRHRKGQRGNLSRSEEAGWFQGLWPEPLGQNYNLLRWERI